MDPTRRALFIGNAKFDDTDNFPDLLAPLYDVQALASILSKHGDFEVAGTLLNAKHDEIIRAIDEFYFEAKRGQWTLLYYSGHGYVGNNQNLFLVAENTLCDRLISTGIDEYLIRNAMASSDSRHHILILDCCFSGAFLRGKKTGQESLILKELKGEAEIIMTSSRDIQYSFEDGEHSIFTRFLHEGISTGQADRDCDGYVGISELFEYTEQKVKNRRTDQSPMFYQKYSEQAHIWIARNPVFAPALPKELVMAINCKFPRLREGAVKELGDIILDNSEPALVQIALQALNHLAKDPDPLVSEVTQSVLQTYSTVQEELNLQTIVNLPVDDVTHTEVSVAGADTLDAEYERAINYEKRGSYYPALSTFFEILSVNPTYKDVNQRIEEIKKAVESGHELIKIDADSPYTGQLCPVTRNPLRAGNVIVLCKKSNEIISMDGWRFLDRCPFCGDITTVGSSVPPNAKA